jgi:hypothetical protein
MNNPYVTAVVRYAEIIKRAGYGSLDIEVFNRLLQDFLDGRIMPSDTASAKLAHLNGHLAQLSEQRMTIVAKNSAIGDLRYSGEALSSLSALNIDDAQFPQSFEQYHILFSIYNSENLKKVYLRTQALLNANAVDGGASQSWDSGFDKDAMRVLDPSRITNLGEGWYIITLNLLYGWGEGKVAKSPKQLREQGLPEEKYFAGVEALMAFATLNDPTGLFKKLRKLDLYGCDLCGLEQGAGFACVPYFYWNDAHDQFDFRSYAADCADSCYVRPVRQGVPLKL